MKKKYRLLLLGLMLSFYKGSVNAQSQKINYNEGTILLFTLCIVEPYFLEENAIG